MLAFQIAIQNEFITAEMVEATEFHELSNQFNISGVPNTIINSGKGELVGAASAQHLIEEIRNSLDV